MKAFSEHSCFHFDNEMEMDDDKRIAAWERQYPWLETSDIPFLPKHQTLIDGFMWRGPETYLLSGLPNTYKSFIAAEIAVALAAGLPLFGALKIHGDPGPVFLFTPGRVNAILGQRIPALAGHRNADMGILKKFLSIIPEVPQPGMTGDVEYVATVMRRERDRRGRQMQAIIVDIRNLTVAGLPLAEKLAADRYTEMVEEWTKEFECPVLTVGRFDVNAPEGAAGHELFQIFTDNVFQVEAVPQELRDRANPPWATVSAVGTRNHAEPLPIFLEGERIIVDGKLRDSLAFNAISPERFDDLVHYKKTNS